MQRSEQIGQLIAALAKSQAAFKAVGKDKTAKIQSQKGAFSYAYADLATVVDATRPALTANGLAVVQPVRLGDGQIVVTTILAHASGEWLSEEMSWPVAEADNRSIGSGITYARRHSYLAIVGGAATDEDDDAEQARGGNHETARPQSRTEAVKEQVRAATKGKPEERKHRIVARMGVLGFDAPSIGAWVNKTLGKAKAENSDDLDKLEAAVTDLEQARQTLGAEAVN